MLDHCALTEFTLRLEYSNTAISGNIKQVFDSSKLSESTFFWQGPKSKIW